MLLLVVWFWIRATSKNDNSSHVHVLWNTLTPLEMLSHLRFSGSPQTRKVDGYYHLYTGKETETRAGSVMFLNCKPSVSGLFTCQRLMCGTQHVYSPESTPRRRRWRLHFKLHTSPPPWLHNTVWMISFSSRLVHGHHFNKVAPAWNLQGYASFCDFFFPWPHILVLMNYHKDVCYFSINKNLLNTYYRPRSELSPGRRDTV